LIFQREEGYFLGSMYFSYLLGAILLGASYLLAIWLLPEWNGYLLFGLILIPYFLLTPVLYRYARTIWIYFERWGCPGDASASAYEKMRAREFAERINRPQ